MLFRSVWEEWVFLASMANFTVLSAALHFIWFLPQRVILAYSDRLVICRRFWTRTTKLSRIKEIRNFDPISKRKGIGNLLGMELGAGKNNNVVIVYKAASTPMNLEKPEEFIESVNGLLK